MNTPMVIFIMWCVGLLMGAIPAWIIAKVSLPKNWFLHLSFARSTAPIITGYPIKPNQRAVTIKEGGRKLRYQLLDGYGSPYAVGRKAHKGTMYLGHAQAGGPVTLRGQKAPPDDAGDAPDAAASDKKAPPENGVLVAWDWKVAPITPSAAEMAAAQDDDREIKMVQASRKAGGAGIPLMYILVGAGVLFFMFFMR